MPSRGTEASNVRHGASGPQHTQGKGSSDDRARFFSFTITVRPNNDHVGDRSCRIESVTSSLENYVRKTGEGVLDQFFDGKCLTLHGAMRFSATHSRAVLRRHMRGQLVLKCFRDRPDSVIPKCIVTAHCEDERHAINETLRRMVHPSGTAGEAGQQRPHAARIVLDTAGSAAAGPAAAAAGSAADSATAGPAATGGPAGLAAAGARAGAAAGLAQAGALALDHTAGSATVTAGGVCGGAGAGSAAPAPAGPARAGERAGAAACATGAPDRISFSRSHCVVRLRGGAALRAESLDVCQGRRPCECWATQHLCERRRGSLG